MIATTDQISTVIKTNPNKALLKKAQEYADKMMLHLYGKGMDSAIDQCKHFVNDDLYQVQKKYATSNKDVFGRLLQQEDMIFTARGGGQYFGMSDADEKQMNALLDDVRYDMSLRRWVKGFALPAYRSDPMGIIFMEVEKMGDDLQTPNIYPTYKSSYDIFDYLPNGRELEYVCFRLRIADCQAFGINDPAHEGMSGDQLSQYFRFVDDKIDGIFLFRNGTVTEYDVLDHGFDETPGFIISDLIRFDDPQCFISPLDLTVELADSFLYDRSVRDLQKKYHGFAKAIEPLLKCGTCTGQGMLGGNPCPDCTPPGADVGTGYKTKTKVADVARFSLDLMQNAGFDFRKIFGYVEPDIKGWEKQDASLDDLEELMEMTYWGVVRMRRPKAGSSSPSQPVTATESVSNNQPKYARLNLTADWAEKTEKMIADFMGEFWFPGTYKEASVSYGRLFVLETPDEIMKSYQSMRTVGSPDFILDEQLEKYYNALYQNNPIQLAKYLKLLRIEPFPHITIVQAKVVIVDPDDFNCKLYFGEWYSSIADIKIIMTPDVTLRQMLKDYVAAKNIVNPLILPAETARVN